MPSKPRTNHPSEEHKERNKETKRRSKTFNRKEVS